MAYIEKRSEGTGAMGILILLLFAAIATACSSVEGSTRPSTASTRAGECVILLHGLGRTESSMKKMARGLSSEGFSVANIGYASRSAPIKVLADLAISDGLEKCRSESADTVHFVTHSLGGVLLRQYLSEQPIDGLGRSVMLAPPNQGSAAADAFRRVPGYRLLNGEAGLQLGTGADSVPLHLGAARFDVGIIAGDRTIDPLTSLFLDNPDDGKVSVESTKLEGMSDFLLVHHSHAFIMKSDEVIRQTRHYLDFGEFDHSDTREAAALATDQASQSR